ncbi:hypothetical protein [Pseudomonas syringae]|uniref:hypothetical protein n=1 Tax=Pseudomonas syringae TaxID=317 RepID=UPI0003730CE2|nr:hypothetical protein [Pseudomonas syringae]
MTIKASAITRCKVCGSSDLAWQTSNVICTGVQQEAQLFFSLDVSSVFDLMRVTGLSFERIPPELRHLGISTYVGNSILSRLDPLSDLRNPWDKPQLSFVLPVSLQAFKEFRRRRGLSIPKAGELEAFANQQAEELRVKRKHQATDTASTVAGLEL